MPTNALELALWMESDRMGYLLPALTDAKFENQRDVVLNERRQNYENRPYGLAPMAMLAALFPPDHPYHWTTIGEIDDLRAAKLDDVREFFRTYYHPANASLALAGDIDHRRARSSWRDAYFGDLPPGRRSRRCSRTPRALAGETRLCSKIASSCRGSTSRGISPAMFADGRRRARSRGGHARQRQDVAALSRAGLRAAHRDRRLGGAELARARRLLPGRGDRGAGPLAGRARAGDRRRSRSGWRPKDRRDDEMERGRVQAEAQFMFRLQTVGGFGGKSDQLNAYNVFLGDPDFFDRDLDALSAGHRASRFSRRSSGTWRHARRVALSVVPRGRAALALPGSVAGAVS